jgi:hypothetical protein
MSKASLVNHEQRKKEGHKKEKTTSKARRELAASENEK